MTSTHIFAIADGDKIRVDGPDGERFLIEFNQLSEEGYAVTLAQVEDGAVVQSLEMRSHQFLGSLMQSDDYPGKGRGDAGPAKIA